MEYKYLCQHTNKEIETLHSKEGSLKGLNFVCSDLFHVKGQTTCAGNPDFLNKHPNKQEKTAKLILVGILSLTQDFS